MLLGLIAVVAFVKWEAQRPPFAIEDFYQPSAEAIASCTRGRPWLGNQALLSDEQCQTLLIQHCANDDVMLANYHWPELKRCTDAKDRIEHDADFARSMARHLKDNLSFLVTFALLLAIGGGIVLAWRDGEPAREARRARRMASRDRSAPAASTVHDAAKAAGFFWGRAERHLAGVKRAFDHGRSVSAATAVATVREAPATHAGGANQVTQPERPSA